MAQTTIADIRAKYPQYDRLSDRELADKLHAKFYAQMDKADFYGRVGLSESAKPLPSAAGDGADTQGFADPLLEAMRQPIPAPLADSQAAAGPAAGGPPPAVTPPGRVPQPQAMAQPGTRTEAAPSIDQARPPSPPPTPRDLDRILFGMMGGSSPETEAWARREIARQEAERGNGQNADPLLQAMAPAPQQQPSPGTVNKPGTVLSRTAKATGQALRNVPENLLTGWYGMKLAKSELGQEVNPTDIAAQMQGATELAAVEEQMAAMKAVMDKGPREAAALQDQYLALSQRRGQLRSLYGAAAETIASEAAQLSRFEAAGEAARKKIGDLEKSKVKVDAEPGSPEYYVSAAIASSAEMAPALAASAIMRNPAPAMIFMGGYSGGTSYVEGRKQGLSPHDARGYATLYAAAEGIPEALPVSVLLKPGQKFLTRIISGAAAEGAQEMITEALQIGIDKGYVSPDMTWAEARARIADAGIIGTLAGGTLGTAVGTFDAALNVRNRDRREKDDAAAAPRPARPVAATSAPAQPAAPAADPLLTAMGGQPQPVPAAPPAPVQPAAPAADAAPIPVDKPAERPEDRKSEAEPDEAPQYEILDEVETVDGETRPTGRKVRVDLTTGEASVVDATEAAGTAPASAPAATRDQPESQPQSKPEHALVGAQPEPAAGGARPAPQRRFLTHEETLAIETDPQTFQYKGGADTEGVTTALQGVTRFDPNRAGQVVLFETRDGRLIVADGHQRTGLARRMAAAGQEDVGGMAAVIYREADGYTPEEVMRLAAIKNIGEGSGSAVDAARVLRSSAETVEDLGLPPQSALVRTAEGLRRLSDEAFGMVVNGRASERDGAIVGRVVANRDAQIGILGLLARLKPANAFQAESIARQAAAEVTTETQSSLFGDEEVAANLYLERAKILDNAVKRLADEKRLFGTLTERIEAITAAGNVLAKDENARRVDLAARMRDYLASQANLKGPISDALSQAARDLKAGTPVATATGRFLESLQRAMEVGGGRGEAAPGGRSVDQGEGRREEPQRQEVSPPEDDLLAAMGVKPDPATRPEPKPEPAPQDGDDLLAAMGAKPQKNPEPDRRARDEARVRGGQSKIRTGAPQKDAGPLFDTQGDIEKAAAKPSGHDLIMRGRAILAPFERDRDDVFDRNAGDDLTGSAHGRALADELAGAASLKEKTDIAVRWVTEQGKRTGVEHGVILDADGVPLAIMSGRKSGVSFHSAVWRAGAAGKIAVSVHNHPSSGGPSAADLAVLALWPKHRMVIAGHNGDRHEITATEAFDKAAMMDDAKPAYSMLPTREELEPVFEAIRVKLNTRAWEIAKERSQADGGEAAFHKAMRPAFALAMERAGMIRYTDTAGWLRSMQAEGFDFEAIHGQISGTLADRLRRAGFDVSKVGDRGGDQAAGSGTEAAPPGTDSPDREPAPDGERGDRGGRVPPPDEVAPDDFDAALDAVFGAEKPAPQSSSISIETLRNWRNSVPSTGTVSGWTVFDDTEIGSGWVLMSKDQRVGPFATEATAREWAKDNAANSGMIQMTPAPRSSSDIAKDLGDLFNESDAGFREGEIEAEKYARAIPLFREALAGVDMANTARKDVFVAMIRPLAAAGLGRDAVAKMRPYFDRFLRDLDDGIITLDQEASDAPGTGGDLERDRGDAGSQDRLGKADVPAATRGDGSRAGTRGATPDGRGKLEPGGERVSPDDATPVGTGRDQGIQGDGRAGQQPADDRDGSAGRDDGEPRVPDDDSPAGVTRTVARNSPDLRDRVAAQKAADEIARRGIRLADEANIRETLPLLLPEQQDDVVKIERRFLKPDGHGMLITNGTGTGKTYSGGGVIKRFAQQGKTDILVLAPSQGILDHWIDALHDLGLSATKLESTTDAGRGIVLTTYANAGVNTALARRKWDLVVSDEAHKLSQNAAGDPTDALNTLRAITNRPADLWRKSDMLHADEWAKMRAMKDGEAKTAEAHRLFRRRSAEVEAMAKEPRPKVLFLSATPFAYDKNIDYGEGYLFDYPEDGHVGHSRQSGQNLFMVANFGYRIRQHKLTRPDANVDSGVFEREFHEKLRREGMLSGRHLDIEPDYERRFILRDDAQGAQIDGILDFIRQEAYGKGPDKDAYTALLTSVNRQFNHLRRMQLLEAIKARLAQADIDKHLALGRKVVIFHDYNVGGGFNPFRPADAAAAEGYVKLIAARPEVEDLNFTGYLPPVQEIKRAYGDRAVIYNGTVPQKERAKAKAAFNKDGSGVDIMIVQSAAGEAGISLHDVTGGHQRVLVNLGMPTRPTTALQEEGRIRREGSVSDALFHYYTIGTNWERQAFARKIAERSGTVENLALGNEARTIRDSFIEAYENASPWEPGEADGKGGKARDRAIAKASPYEIAKTHYFGRMKTAGRRDQREGIDFYPTPEPLAFKMVEWAGIRPYERVLEPSAGDGSIARYFPEHSDRTIVEPSSDLLSRAELRAVGARAVGSTFEAYHIVNKHHVIVMNPPFGMGGKTAMEHLAKAARHLRPGGRIVALIPTGPAADKRFDAWWDSDDSMGLVRAAEVALPAVTFEKAGTAIAAKVVILDKPHGEVDPVPARRINMTGASTIGEFFDRLEGISVPDRPAQQRDAADEIMDEEEAANPPMAAPERPAAPLHGTDQEFTLGETTHGKTGEKLWVATATKRVDDAAWKATVAVAKRHGGWFSSFRGRGAIPGYQFKSEADRQAFLDDMKKPTVGFEQPAWHGSPHIFDRFSLDKIGTGEGVQAYGWGLYFAGRKGVAKYYRDKLSRGVKYRFQGKLYDSVREVADKIFRDMDFDPLIPNHRGPSSVENEKMADEILKGIEAAAYEQLSGITNEPALDTKLYKAGYEYAQEQLAEVETIANKGRLYSVKIPEDEDLLDYDKPLSQQPEKVRKALETLGITYREPRFEWRLEKSHSDGAGGIVKETPNTPTPGAVYRLYSVNEIGGERASSNYFLKSKGSGWDIYRGGRYSGAFMSDDLTKEVVADEKARMEDTERRMMATFPDGGAATGRDIYAKIGRSITGGSSPTAAWTMTGDVVKGTDQKASEALRAAGIPGLRYLDNGSRGAAGSAYILTGPDGYKWTTGGSMTANMALSDALFSAVGKKGAPALSERAMESAIDEIMDGPAKSPEAREVWAFLQSLGWKQSSGGTYNYVIFDADVIEITGFEETDPGFARDPYEPLPREAIAAMMPRLRAELDRLDLKRVRLFQDNTAADWQGMFLRYPGGGMAIVVAASLDPMKTIHHEVIHALRSMNLFTPAEWRALEIKAARTWVEQFDIAERYPNLMPSEQIEEAIAEAFAEAASTKTAPRGAILVRAFNKIARFLRAVRNALRGAGFQTPEDIFGRVLAGQLSRRNAGNTGAMAAFHEEARFQAARVPSRQARAHMASALGGTPHIPDRRIWEELTRAGRPIWARLREGLGAANDAVDKARIRLQDRFLPVLRAQQAVMRATGAPLPADHDAYIAETTFSGKVGRHLFEIDEDYTKPIIKLIAATKGALTADDVGEWLTARHAVERNARIASINPKMPDGGSGMMTADAQAILAAAAAGPHAQTLDEIGDLIDKLRERTLKLREDAGLITHQEANLWRTQYRHYVPLKGFAETDLAEAVLDLTGTGRRFNVRGPESKRALGRRSEAFNPLQAAITQAQEVSIRAERNRVGQAIYNLAKDFPSPALWSVKTVKMKRFYNRTTGLVESRPEDPVSLFLDPNEMAVKVGGEEKRVIFHDPRLARAAGSVGADQMGWFVSMMSIAARYFSSINTMLDPEFVIRNAFRDMTAAHINIRNFGEADRNAIAKAMIRDWPKAFVGAFRGMGNKADSTWTRLYREFEQSGAKVSFWRLEQPEAGKADLDKRIRMAGGSRMGPASRFVRFSTRDNPVLGFIERTNLAVDNAIRLAAYVEARKRGWDKGQAAALAKNLTVNFNRRGEWGATINALYPFANASIQGTQILFRAMTSKRMAKYAIGMVALGIIMDAVNAGLSHEDDDGELAYDKIPDWKNRTNLAVMLGPDAEEAASIWLPYGYSLFPYLGQQIGKVARGVKKPETAMADFAAAIFLAFSPITGEDFQSTLTPTMLDPINEMAMNQDWLGRPIRPENAYADFGPNAYKYYAGVSEASKQIADAMNRATGGTIAERGWLDVSPEYIDHMFGFATGGAGRTVGRAVDLVAKSVTGNFEEIELRDVPVARSLVYATGDWLDRDRYYRFRDQVKEAHASAKIYQEAGKPVPKHIARIDALYSDMLAAEKVLRAIKKQGGGDQTKVFLAFNKRYLRVAGRQGE